MAETKVIYSIGKEVKHSVRYEADSDHAPVSTLYVKKSWLDDNDNWPGTLDVVFKKV